METFSNLLKRYYEFKRQHSPYDYREWRVGGEVAKQCKSILDEIAEHIKVVLIQKGLLREGDFTVTSASGTGYYPKSPWIGIFKNGECATDGVYPVLGFYNDSDGCFIGCVESFTNPQFGFQSKYCLDDNLTEDEKSKLKAIGLDNDSHIARMPHIFSSTCEISEDSLLQALQSALNIQIEYRRAYPRKNQVLGCANLQTGGVSGDNYATWYKEIYVDEISKWLGFVTSPPTQTKDKESWIFRGQGDASWHLESLLYRCFGSIGDSAEIKAIETNAITAFKREAYDSPLCQRLNGVNILAVMQHYGSATRLLDFTYAPLTALFFAIEQRDTLLSKATSYCEYHAPQLLQPQKALDDNVSVAVWAFQLRSVLGISDCNLDSALEKSTKDAHRIVLTGPAKNCGSGDKNNGKGDDGINVVMPKFGNERLSAQSGLFLMARNIGKPFEENLRVVLPNLAAITKEDCRRENISTITDWNTVIQKFSVVKFVFPSTKVRELKTMLKSLHITYKTIYPDLMGIAKDATAET